MQRSKKPQQIRGLNRNHNPEMKEIFKSTATRASCGTGPFHEFYAALLAKGMEPEMARLTLARKIAAITLTHLDTLEEGGTFRRRTIENASRLSMEQNPGDLPRFSCLGGGQSVLAMLGFEGEYLNAH